MHKSPISSASMSVIPHNIKRQLIIFAINSCHSPKITQLLIMALVSSAERKTKLIFHCYSTNKQNMCILPNTLEIFFWPRFFRKGSSYSPSIHVWVEIKIRKYWAVFSLKWKYLSGDKCESIFLCIKLILNVNQKTSFLHDEWHQNVRKGLSMLLS